MQPPDGESAVKDSERQAPQSASVFDWGSVEEALAIVLSGLLAIIGLILLPTEHRAAMVRLGAGTIVVILAICAGLLAGAASSGRRRRRY
jgi:hypothetical protein